MIITEKAQWIPRKISFAFGEPVVELVTIKQKPNYFFSDLELSHPLKTTRIPLMDIQLPEVTSAFSPHGILFHTPRSGSTLVAQMLSRPDNHLILVEPEPINALLSNTACPAIDPLWLRQLLKLYMLAFYPHYNAFFIKTSSWAIVSLALFEKAFPDSPTCLIYREPVEVLVQILQRNTGWMSDHARPFILGMKAKDCMGMSIETYSAEALARFFFIAVTARSPMLLLKHDTLPEIVTGQLLAHFKISVDAKQQRSMLAQAGYDSEYWAGKKNYVDDSARLNNLATEEIRSLAEQIVLPAMRRLESKHDNHLAWSESCNGYSEGRA